MGSPLPELDVTNRFVLDQALQHRGRVLDYGCGAGRTVARGRASGLDIYGCDVFYGGSASRTEAESTGLFGEVIRPMDESGRIPFPDGFFDLVTNNQVMEHVEDLPFVLGEVQRVLKPGGTVLSVFPSSDVWREGHIGIPFAHWWPKGSYLRFLYTWVLRAAGLGTWKEQAPTPRQWAVDKLEWIDRWTRYRTRGEIFGTWRRYFEAVETRERDYIIYRLKASGRGWLISTAMWPLIGSLEVWLFRKLAFLVIVARKAGR